MSKRAARQQHTTNKRISENRAKDQNQQGNQQNNQRASQQQNQQQQQQQSSANRQDQYKYKKSGGFLSKLSCGLCR